MNTAIYNETDKPPAQVYNDRLAALLSTRKAKQLMKDSISTPQGSSQNRECNGGKPRLIKGGKGGGGK